MHLSEVTGFLKIVISFSLVTHAFSWWDGSDVLLFENKLYYFAKSSMWFGPSCTSWVIKCFNTDLDLNLRDEGVLFVFEMNGIHSQEQCRSLFVQWTYHWTKVNLCRFQLQMHTLCLLRVIGDISVNRWEFAVLQQLLYRPGCSFVWTLTWKLRLHALPFFIS